MKKPKPRWPGDGLLGELSDFAVARDGQSVRVPMLWMDSSMAGHRNGYALLTDEQVAKRQEARSAYVRDLSSAWRLDAKRKKPDDEDEDDDVEDRGRGRRRSNDRAIADARAAARASYDSMCARLQQGWRTPFSDGVEPSGRTRPGFDPREPGGETDPDRAAAMESQIERWKGLNAATPGSVSSGPGSGASVRQVEIDLEKRRQATAAAYSAKISESWKNPAAARPPQTANIGAGPRAVVQRVGADPARAVGVE
jgi:hypothetical protein